MGTRIYAIGIWSAGIPPTKKVNLKNEVMRETRKERLDLDSSGCNTARG